MNRSGVEKIGKMEIAEGISSDHLVLKVTLNTEITREEKLEKERETTRWTEEEILEYKKCLEMQDLQKIGKIKPNDTLTIT